MNVDKKQLQDAIIALTKGKELKPVLDIVLDEMDEMQLQSVICVLMDPDYHKKQDVLTDPKRFTSKGELAEVNKRSLDVKIPSRHFEDIVSV